MAKIKSEPRTKRTKGTSAPLLRRRAGTFAEEPAEGGAEDRGDAQFDRPHDEDEREGPHGDGDDGTLDATASGSSRPGEFDEEGEIVEVVGEVVDGADADADADADGDDGEDIELPRSTRAAERIANRGGNEAALSRTDPLQAYLREVQRHPLLTAAEEKELTIRYVKSPDVATAARLVSANLRLVVKLAYEYRRAYKNIMDLIQEGNIGLMQAVKRYDPYRGVKLSSYSAWWIRAYILRFILNNWRLVKLGTTQAQRKLFFNLSKEKAKLSALGIEPTAAEIAKRLSVEEKEVVDMDSRLSSGEASLDAPAGDMDGRSMPRVELLPSADVSPDVAFEASEVGSMVHEQLGKFRETLKGKEMIIFDKRMVAEDPLTLQELGNEFGVSRERVRQLEARLHARLREHLQEELGDAVDLRS